MEFEKHQTCLVCHSKSLRQLPEFSVSFLVRCQQCGFVFSERIPSLSELEAHYEGYGRNDFLSPITVKRYQEILDSFEPFRKTNKLIDVGCGIGYFLEEAKKRGWQVYGTEYTDVAVKICQDKGISIIKGALNTSNYEEETFDVVTSFEVLEHINNPLEEVENFHKILRKGGLLYFTTPNFNAIERYYLGSKYNVVGYPEHLSYYTKKTMNTLLEKVGFQKEKITTTGVSLTRIKTSTNNSSAKYVEENNEDDKMRNMMEEKLWAKFIKSTANGVFDLFGIGNSLKGYYIKK